VESRDEILIRSFNEGYTATTESLGANRGEWRWGVLHTSSFVSNPLGLSGIDVIEGFVNSGPVETSGASDMVNATAWTFNGDDGANPFQVRALPSMRMVVDLADLSASQTIHTTGQSGHPASPNYADFVDDWRNIDYHPMLWTSDDVNANAAATLILQPAD
jgi:penicillin G amidase